MAKNLAKEASKREIKYFLISFVDMLGQLRAKLVPAAAIGAMQETGAGFAGFAAWLDMTPADPDMFAIPDPDSLIQLPWKPEVGWLAADLWMNGAPVEASPRVALKRQIEAATARNHRIKTGVECEYFLLNQGGDALSDDYDTEEKPCYDQSALMRRYDVISEICDAMLGLGWKPYQNDHEDGNGQFEMNWEYDDALVTADRHTFFKYMTKSIAANHGYRATFMPKPFANLTGNGCHAHVSSWTLDGENNRFSHKTEEMGLSKIAYRFLGGLVHNAKPLSAIFLPTVNSYKRIDAAVTTSGATWSPNAVTYGGNNRTHMIRIPDPGRFELRLADGAANPYLLQAGVIAAGLDGLANDRDPGERLDINMYTSRRKISQAKKLPANLLDAIRLFDESDVVREAFGKEFVDSYVKLKMDEWERFTRSVTPWEREHTLDC